MGEVLMARLRAEARPRSRRCFRPEAVTHGMVTETSRILQIVSFFLNSRILYFHTDWTGVMNMTVGKAKTFDIPSEVEYRLGIDRTAGREPTPNRPRREPARREPARREPARREPARRELNRPEFTPYRKNSGLRRCGTPSAPSTQLTPHRSKTP